jgi:cytoskeletal protein CcmA (bactofilin family)
VLFFGADMDMLWEALLRLVNQAGPSLKKVLMRDSGGPPRDSSKASSRDSGKPSSRDSGKPNLPEPVKPEAISLPPTPSWLGPSLHIKGEICGSEDLLIDGSVEGIVQLEKQKLILGATSRVKADIIAGDVIVSGNLQGNVRAKSRIEIKKDGSVTGDLTTPQISIEDGACFKGSIEIETGAEKETVENSLPPTESVQNSVAHV